MKKKLVCAILCVVLLFTLTQSEMLLVANAIIPGEDAYTGEEKVYCDVSLEDDFNDEKVIVVLSNEASLSMIDYSASHFPEIAVTNLKNLSEATTTLVEAKLTDIDVSSQFAVPANTVTFNDYFDIDTTTFHQILSLTLVEPGKQNVIDAISVLMERDDVIYAGPDYIGTLDATTPNDTSYSSCWANSTINLPEAWDITTGSLTVQVGVLDSGIDGAHPDLCNRVSLSLSRDFSYGGCTTLTEVTDPNGHGTHVAGIIAAQGNNGIGIAGVAWYTRLVSLRTNDEDGTFYYSNMISAIDYATSIGLPILNCSNSGSAYDYAWYTAIANYPGLFVCSAGNDGTNIDSANSYPARFGNSNLIAVASSTSTDTRASGSNYGLNTVDLFAPGVGILSCYPTDLQESGYRQMSGTSMAAPFVAGVAALMLAEDPDLTVAEIKANILATVDPVSAFSSLCVSGGRLNAYAAVLSVHDHAYTSYTSYNAAKHKCSCSCGDYTLETHTFPSSGAVGDGTITYTCTKCGYRKTVAT